MHRTIGQLIVILVGTAVTPVLLTAQGAAVRIPPGATMAFVNPPRVLAESTAGRAHLAKIQALQQQKANDLRTRQQALADTQRQLAAATGTAARVALQQKEQTDRADLEKAVAQAQAELQGMQRQVNTAMQEVVRSALDDLLAGTDVRIVLNSESAIVWGSPAVDLTSAVIERLNARTAETAKP